MTESNSSSDDSNGDSPPDLEDEIDNSPLILSCENRGEMLTAWFMAVLWSALSIYFTQSFLSGDIDLERDGILYGTVFLIFPGGSLFLIGRALLVTVRWRKFGESKLELPDGEGVVGKKLRGVLKCSRTFKPTTPYKFKLECLETKYRRSSKGGQKKVVKSIWQSEISVPERAYSPKSGIPFEFEIPADAYETGSSKTEGEISWGLSVKAATSGVNYEAQFGVPVSSSE